MDSLSENLLPDYRNHHRHHRCMTVILLTIAIGTTSIGIKLLADETPSSATFETGSDVPSFYVRAVTGPLAGKSVCYVCRNGDRPAVIVLLRELDADSTALLKDLDQLVNLNRAQGLRCFAVLLTDSPQRDAARLQTLAFDEKISLPLTLASQAAIQGSTLAVPGESELSVITYSDRKVVERFSFRSGGCDEKSRKSILAASQKLLVPE